MDNQTLPPEKAKSKKTLITVLWIIATIAFCATFAIILAPKVKAQARGEQNLASQYSTIIRNVFNIIQRDYVLEIEPELLFEGAMTGMLNSLEDPHSVFLTENDMKDVNDMSDGNYGGIGLYVSKENRSDGKPSYLEVAAPMEDTPGWRAGLYNGDLILEINGESTDLLSSDEAVARLRGRPGSEVKLLIRRGEKLEFQVTLVRAVIEVPTTKHGMIGDIGYLKLITFTPMTAERSRDAIRDFQSNAYSGFILDLRNNAGGRLDAAVAVSSLFLDGGVVVSTKSRIDSANQIYYARGRALVPANIPIIVLINRGSASASEIVAGALKDRGRAYLVGEKSYGKGSVQQVYPLDKVGFKITVARYYTPSEANIDIVGIPPDREVRLTDFSEEDVDNFNALLNSGRITEYIDAKPEASSSDIDTFAKQLNGEFGLQVSLLRRLIRNEQNRRNIAPAYDLEYDEQLQEAVKILRNENFRVLMQTTKTLKTLQEEAAQEDKFPLAS
jgi:carboxyl-terminal processing protease